MFNSKFGSSKNLGAGACAESVECMLSKWYDVQPGEVPGKSQSSRSFRITPGVTQGCVLRPHKSTAMLQWAMKSWSHAAPLKGFNIRDGQPAMLDLRFADEILVFATSYAEIVSFLHDLITVLSQVGLMLDARGTVVLTNENNYHRIYSCHLGKGIAITPLENG